jgi:hypothetical protein
VSEGYGIETWCLDALQPGRYATRATVVVQALYRRLITPRGTLIPLDDAGGDEESAYGFDVSGFVGAVGYETAAQALASLVTGELLKDDRVLPTLEVTAKLLKGSTGEDEIELSIVGDLADESESFSFTLRVTDVSVDFLRGGA